MFSDEQINVENKVIQQRSPPIPKEVNKFMLQNYGSQYYNSTDIYERNEILKQIVGKLQFAGYKSISVMEVERRLKNMKSHYRRKKADLRCGLVPSVEWEYFKALDTIFTATETFAYNEMNTEIQNTQRKRKIEPKPEDILEPKVEKVDEVPQDLSLKRPKLIEFSDKSGITQNIDLHNSLEEQSIERSQGTSSSFNNTQASTQATQNEDQIRALTVKIIESIRTVDSHRLALDQQRLAMEVRRYELDVVGYQLSDLLHKLTH